jgi:hypothetical protein
MKHFTRFISATIFALIPSSVSAIEIDCPEYFAEGETPSTKKAMINEEDKDPAYLLLPFCDNWYQQFASVTFYKH